MHHKVVKGECLRKTEIDSTFPDKKRAEARSKVLKNSLRGSNIKVWVLPLEEGDPMNYRKPKRGPWVGYDNPGPRRVK